MTCPQCDSGETRVLRTIPGAIVSREHFCFSCCARWWGDENLRAGSLRARDVIAAAHRQHTDSSSERSADSDLSPISDPDPDPISPEKPKRARAQVADLGPEVFAFPVVGDPDVRYWSIRSTQDAELKAAFPDLNVPAQYVKARAWLEANRAKRKTARGMMSFLFRWLDREQNRGGAGASKPAESFAERDARLRREAEQAKSKARAEAMRVQRELDEQLRKAGAG